jgi:hypothetical protein
MSRFWEPKFENLKVCGFPVKFLSDLEVCGDRDRGQTILTNRSSLSGSENKLKKIAGCGFFRKKMKQQYDDRCRGSPGCLEDPGGRKVTCSLVKEIEVEDEGQIPGLRTVENVLFVPHFGAYPLGRRSGARAEHRIERLPATSPPTLTCAIPLEEMSNYFR